MKWNSSGADKEKSSGCESEEAFASRLASPKKMAACLQHSATVSPASLANQVDIATLNKFTFFMLFKI